MRAAIYCRISRDRVGAGLGVGTQEADCRALAERLGHTVAGVYTDNDISAYSGKARPGYRALLAEVIAERIDVVLCWHTDRLHRSPAELETYISTCEPKGVSTHTVKAGTVDLATPAGRMMARTLGNHARYEVEHAIERMRRAKQRSADAGTWKGGRRPFGYEPDGVTVRKSEAALIRRAADDVLAGVSIQAIAREWNRQGSTTTTGKQWPLSAPRRILLRPRNAGLMEHRGEVVGDAQWPAVIEPEKWHAVVRVLRDPKRITNPGSSRVKWLGSGLYRCGVCTGPLRATMSDGYRTYRCPDNHLSRKLDEIDQYVEGVIVGVLRKSDLGALLAQRGSAITNVRELEAQAAELRIRLDQLAEVFTEGGIDAQQLSAGSRKIQNELEEVRTQISASYQSSAFEGVADAADPGEAWLVADLYRKRAVLDALAIVTIKRSSRGRPAGWQPGESYFRPDTVEIAWKAVMT